MSSWLDVGFFLFILLDTFYASCISELMSFIHSEKFTVISSSNIYSPVYFSGIPVYIRWYWLCLSYPFISFPILFLSLCCIQGTGTFCSRETIYSGFFFWVSGDAWLRFQNWLHLICGNSGLYWDPFFPRMCTSFCLGLLWSYPPLALNSILIPVEIKLKYFVFSLSLSVKLLLCRFSNIHKSREHKSPCPFLLFLESKANPKEHVILSHKYVLMKWVLWPSL